MAAETNGLFVFFLLPLQLLVAGKVVLQSLLLSLQLLLHSLTFDADLIETIVESVSLLHGYTAAFLTPFFPAVALDVPDICSLEDRKDVHFDFHLRFVASDASLYALGNVVQLVFYGEAVLAFFEGVIPEKLALCTRLVDDVRGCGVIDFVGLSDGERFRLWRMETEAPFLIDRQIQRKVRNSLVDLLTN